MTRTQKILKGLGLGLAGLLIAVLVAGGLGYGWLNSDSGRAWLIGQIEDAVSTPGEVELSLGSLKEVCRNSFASAISYCGMPRVPG